MTTITHAAILAAVESFPDHFDGPEAAAAYLCNALGVEVPVSEPPAEMVKLAEDFAHKGFMAAQGDPGRAAKISSLLTLQHAVAKCRHVAQACSGHGQHDLAQTAIDCANAITGGPDAG
jgi:hypothetical protein